MSTSNPHPCSGIQKLIFSFLLLLILGACNERNEDSTSTDSSSTSTTVPSTTDATPATTIAAALAPPYGYLYELLMAKAQYKKLRDVYNGNNDKLVFQFNFNKDSVNGPTLIAYAARKGGGGNEFGRDIDPPPARDFYVLEISDIRSLDLDGPTVNQKFVLGDQQITFGEIERKLGISVGNGSADFTLRFIPLIRNGNIYYEICKVGGVCQHAVLETQPSPPANTH